MRMPRLAADIERRLLINYRVDPDVARRILPSPLEPQLVDGSAVAGICLLRLGALRPSFVRPRVGWRTENAAHRIAVTWTEDGTARTGVFVPRRHSASFLPVIAGGRLFPGVHQLAGFKVTEDERRIDVSMTARGVEIDAGVQLGDPWSSGLFPTIDDASDFFRAGNVGLSPSRSGRSLERMVLSTDAWKVDAGTPLSVRSSFFDALPAGSAVLDSVLVMRDVPVTWTAPAADIPLARSTPSVPTG